MESLGICRFHCASSVYSSVEFIPQFYGSTVCTSGAFSSKKTHTPQQQQQFPSLRVADAKHQMLDQPAFCHAKRSRASCEAKVFEVASSCQTAMLYSNIYVCRWTQKVNLLVLHLAAVEESTESGGDVLLVSVLPCCIVSCQWGWSQW